MAVENMFSIMGQLLNGKQLTATRQMTISDNCDIVVLLTDNSAVDRSLLLQNLLYS